MILSDTRIFGKPGKPNLLLNDLVKQTSAEANRIKIRIMNQYCTKT